jgi:hypothetical protein
MWLYWQKMNGVPLKIILGIALAVMFLIVAILVSQSSFPGLFQSYRNAPVELKNYHIAQSNFEPGDSTLLTITLEGKDSTSKPVLIDVELLNSAKQRVYQQYWDNVSVKDGKTVTYEVTTPKTLEPGEYYFWVGVFEPGWGKILRSYETDPITVGYFQNETISSPFSVARK